MSSYTADAVVIGAGVIGSSIALELARSGRNVVVVDKAGGIGHGSTGASSGIVRFHYSTHAGVAASWESVHGWTDWVGHVCGADPAGFARFRRTGLLVLDPVPGASRRATQLFDEVGVPWEEWDAEAIRRRLPHVDPGRFGPPKPVDADGFFAPPRGLIGGTFTADAGYIADPQLAAQNLGVAAQAQGAKYVLRQTVGTLTGDGPRQWRVATSDGTIMDADVVVNAAGPWSSRINELAGVGGDFSVTVRPLRQEVHQVPAPPGFNPADGGPGVSIADPDLGFYVRSAGAEGVLIGGMEPDCDPLEWIDDPDQANPHPTRRVFEAQVLRAARRFPKLRVPNRPSGLAGIYDAASDWTPIYDRTDRDGFYVAMGTSGNQFKNAPVVGILMAALIDAVESGRDHDADPVQVCLPRTGNTLDMSAYSRRRPVNAGSPGSVMG
jgi:glycine/D-amino acid oxidase-like deaminating enzyme